MKKFYIPVTWESWDKVQVEAETIEEAIQYVKDNIYDLDFGQDGGEYIDDSCHIDDGQNGEASIEDTILHLKECCNLPGGIEGINIGEVITEYDDKGQCIYHKNYNDESKYEYLDDGTVISTTIRKPFKKYNPGEK